MKCHGMRGKGDVQISARLALRQSAPIALTTSPHNMATGPPDGRTMLSDAAIAVHDYGSMTSVTRAKRQCKQLTFKIANASPIILKNENWRSIPCCSPFGSPDVPSDDGTGTTESLAWSFSLGFMIEGVRVKVGSNSRSRGVIRPQLSETRSSDPAA
jgi:hypothetical protein